MRNASVSAIIVVYNCERYVRFAVDSVLAQTRPANEVIVVDDGSTDGTRKILESYRDKIKYVYQKNAGEPAARNTGMRHSSSGYVAFLDADDLWLPEKLQLQMELAEAHPEYGLIYSDMTTFDENGVIDKSVRASRGRVYVNGWIFPKLFRETLFQTSAAVLRKDAAQGLGGFNETFFVGCDYEMWLRMSRHFEFGYVDKPLVMYRQHAQMSTQQLARVPQAGMPWQAKVLNRTLELYPEIRRELGEGYVNRRLALPYMWLGRTWMDQGNHIEARRLLSGAMHLSPWNLRYRLAYLATFLSPSQVGSVRRIFRKFRRHAHDGTRHAHAI